MKKISKSSKIDKEQESADRAWLANLKKTEHFQPGTKIKRAHEAPRLILELDEERGAVLLESLEERAEAEWVFPQALAPFKSRN